GLGVGGKSGIGGAGWSGFTVRVIGRRADLSFEGAEYQACDINDFPRLREVIQGCHAVVHLAALPNPSMGAPQEVFRVNAQGTFNVFRQRLRRASAGSYRPARSTRPGSFTGWSQPRSTICPSMRITRSFRQTHIHFPSTLSRILGITSGGAKALPTLPTACHMWRRPACTIPSPSGGRSFNHW
ncbi:MAG: NAD-dependent epimerase/dehydratase family protein, partial [Chloroflexi bacterium]